MFILISLSLVWEAQKDDLNDLDNISTRKPSDCALLYLLVWLLITFHILQKKLSYIVLHTFADTLQKNCPRSMCVSLNTDHKQSWIQADHTSDLIKLNTSSVILRETNFWIGLVSNISRKWVDGTLFCIVCVKCQLNGILFKQWNA